MLVQDLWNLSVQVGNLDLELGRVVTTNNSDRLGFQILWTKLQTDRSTLQLPVRELPAWRVVGSVITNSSDTSSEQLVLNGLGTVVDSVGLLLGGLVGDTDWDDDGLSLSDSWWDH
ncbi:hypothetical protein WICPIJ_005827 [Wickerhamomyces pijperi]|uniref:Uncharacterized protein n=1 Tax=Wickerhamomyces pijperi TaxID=599730 RepID=A0A9P8Q5G1_WICPI|nr:hypothetical protein WICPIJ_005827 [Wickerhamomyces pijperi]